MKTSIVLLLSSALFLCPFVSNGQNTGNGEKNPGYWSEQMIRTVMQLWKDPEVTGKSAFQKWNYEEGVILKGMEGKWELTGNGNYFRYIQHQIDDFIDRSGNIRTYNVKGYKLDDINTGKLLLTLYRVTGQKKYWEAASLLREQLKTQPRTKEGGFWHKTIYPHQMWLDGLYMGAPFYAEYAMLAHEGEASFKDVANQFILMEKHSRDPKTGLLYHGWDESREQKWANPENGQSPHFWDRAMGWYAMALVDALDYFPQNSPDRKPLVQILNRLAKAVSDFQDPVTHCWYQVMDAGNREGNFIEASGSAMFVYALAKGVRKGYLPEKYLKVAKSGFEGIVTQFIRVEDNGRVDLEGTCPVAGLGGNPYRDGSFEYYISQKPVQNDPKGVGAFILAANEMEIAGLQKEGKGLTVTLDHYYNNEFKKDITGMEIPFHYVWEDRANSGFSFWEGIFNYRGVKTEELPAAPTAKNLKNTGIYIIVDPDTDKETASPHYIGPKETEAIAKWVKKGGVLVLMANDKGNAEFEHLNNLAQKFGIRFNENSENRVKGRDFAMGAIVIPSDNPIFRNTKKVYIKELSTLHLNGEGNAVLKLASGEVVAAVSKVGKGTVFAVGDPWFYNEYVDGRKLPEEYQNYQAAADLTDWLIEQAK